MSVRHVGEAAAKLRHDPDMFPGFGGAKSAWGRRPANHGNQRATARRRSALAITLTELMLIAALAIIGFSSRPNAG